MTNADLTTAAAESTAPIDGPPAALRWLLAAGGAIGFLAAFVLTVERFHLLTDPNYTPSCSINSVLSCGSVMVTPQAAIFGFPNPLLGIGGFAIVTTLGVVLLAGARLPRWIWLGLQAGVTAAAVLIHWLIYQSIYTIGALCPYCMVVWAVTIPMFWYVTLYNFRRTRWVRSLTGYHTVVIGAWALFVLGIILTRFWLGNG
ncbi:vitamin K epoxide reductase family protein [Kribbella sp. CA-253562]|uniref:vitamin K epoxide reductase family protein n=1 Tax=Kribbella sp. CA-253562 TaxID=3239942 RepID=UPI003D8B36CA